MPSLLLSLCSAIRRTRSRRMSSTISKIRQMRTGRNVESCRWQLSPNVLVLNYTNMIWLACLGWRHTRTSVSCISANSCRSSRPSSSSSRATMRDALRLLYNTAPPTAAAANSHPLYYSVLIQASHSVKLFIQFGGRALYIGDIAFIHFLFVLPVDGIYIHSSHL